MAWGTAPGLRPNSAARQVSPGGHEGGLIDLDVDVALRDRHAVVAPVPRCVGRRLRADKKLAQVLRPSLVGDAEADFCPLDGCSIAVDHNGPDRPGRIERGGEGGGHRFGMDIGIPARLVRRKAGNFNQHVERLETAGSSTTSRPFGLACIMSPIGRWL